MGERSPPAEPFASEELFSERPSALPLAGALAGAGAAGALVCTQLLAERLGHHPVLGPPLLPGPGPALPTVAALTLAGAVLALGLARPATRTGVLLIVPLGLALAFWLRGPLYPPARGAIWAGRLLRTAEGRALLARPGWTALEATTLVALAALVLDALHRRRRPPASVAHGSARYATARDLAAAGLLGPGEGVVLGAWGDGRAARLLLETAGHHVLVVLPPGGGKTSGPIATTLLGNPSWSTFVLDPKGELWDLTAGYRSRAGHHCIRFAPHAADSPRWNCLAEVERGPREVKFLSAIADNLVSYPATAGGDSHWISAARTLFRCLALHVLYSHTHPSMPVLRQLLNDPHGRGGVEGLFRGLMAAPHDPGHLRGWVDPTTGKPTPTHPEVARIARALAETPPRERGSIISTLNQFLAVWGDELVAVNTATSDFNLHDLAARTDPVSLYVSISFDELARLAPLIRIMASLLTVKITSADLRAGRPPASRRLLLVLDEFAALGRLPILEEMLAFLRGYGVTALIALQDLNQLRRLYSDRESISGTCQTHVLGATQNTATREHASRLAGEATVRFRRRSVGRGMAPHRPGTTLLDAEAGRPLVTEGEVGALPPDRLLVFRTGMPPILARKRPYFADPALSARAGLESPPGIETESADPRSANLGHWKVVLPEVPPNSARPDPEEEAEAEPAP